MRLFSWLGQMVRRRPRRTAETERRVWVRLPVQLPADHIPVRGPSGARWSVELIDISRGGMRMAVTEPVEPGAFVSVEVPGEPNTTVLACVVRAVPRAGGEWEVGCAFSAEISDEDVRKLGGEKINTEPSDRRGWERALSNKSISFQVVGTEVPTWKTATLVDVSAGGAALRVNQPVDLQTMLRLELRGGDWRSAAVLLASVIRITELHKGDWVLGCSFVRELDEQELEAILD